MIKHVPVPEPLKPKPEDVDLYARALALSHAPRQTPLYERLLNWVYWGMILAALIWVASMVLDREPPVRQISREIVNPDKQVRPGERLLIQGSRVRVRQCELTRRWWIIDGMGRRLDFEPERFDAYGEVGSETEIIGPFVPLDAMPGRGRILGVLAYDCNPLQRALGWSIVVMLPALEFEILPRERAP
ncbi:hypothetical protein BHAOGJBA_1667 [Methylobacterium hispanicum]|uniref:DUF4131 domain-containing protein n=1 Tax=Methylobacterium hispanicum TaxID=270350 RepID=A0AAV4ZJR7_9HYPH|nr:MULTISPECIES: hypothetical protein [Methylobacterium]GJD88154.1 hypothetical protein BHAOGJBA_1667 [Methylobacterium hispanicum]